MGATPIEWCDHSINPLKARNIETNKVGHFCVKISPGCKGCYSSKMQKPFLTQLEFVAENRPKVELFFDWKAIEQVLKRKKPTRYFWCDMTDLFWEDWPDEWIERCFAAMRLTPQHTHLVLTKRGQRMVEYFRTFRNRNHCVEIENVGRGNVRSGCWIDPLPNVWLGVSVEDKKRKDRIDLLRDVPAAVRFLSLEPLLEDLGELDLRGIHWAIIGGESGSRARPFDIQWPKSIIEQCRKAGVAPFLKQVGAKPMYRSHGDNNPKHLFNGLQTLMCNGKPLTKKGGNMEEWPHHLRVREFPQ